jgi:hypothetical protein
LLEKKQISNAHVHSLPHRKSNEIANFVPLSLSKTNNDYTDKKNKWKKSRSNVYFFKTPHEI